MNEVKLYKTKETDRINGCQHGYAVHFEGKRIGQVAHDLYAGGWWWRAESTEGVPTGDKGEAPTRGKATTALLANVAGKSGPREEVSMTVKVAKSRVGDLLCTAFEGGSNYWYTIEGYVEPKGEDLIQHTTLGQVFRHIDYPLCKGGAVVISDRLADSKPVTRVALDWPMCQRGLEVMQRDYARHFADWLAERDDAATGDVFLQCAVFGKVIYG